MHISYATCLQIASLPVECFVAKLCLAMIKINDRISQIPDSTSCQQQKPGQISSSHRAFCFKPGDKNLKNEIHHTRTAGKG